MKFDFFFKSPTIDSYYEPIWDNIMTIKEFKDMETCPHSKKWHKEGSPLEHTKMVLKNAIWYLSHGGFSEHVPIKGSKCGKVFLLAALFHDIGKPQATIEKNGDYTCPFHGEIGSGIARRLLFDEDIDVREAVCFMVRKHMVMHNLSNYKDPLKIKKELAYFDACFYRDSLVTWDMMCALSLCDEMGSIRFDETFFEKYNRQAKLIDLPYVKCGISYDHPLRMEEYNELFDLCEKKDNDEDPIDVFVMIGMAGSGKSTYIKEHKIDGLPNISGLPVISRDIMRAELGYCKPGEKKILSKEQEDEVSTALTNKMIELAGEGKSFVIDNMNLKLGYRMDYHRLLDPIHKIRWVYIYVEAPSIEENIRRRKDDFGEKTESIVNSMIERFEYPYPWEYDILITQKQ